MIPITVQDLKNIQLDMLKSVHAFCVRENINYFLGYGTMLGAVRHKGYIPWDDDIDVFMPRPDYDRFVQEYNDDNRIYKVVSIDNSDSYTLPFAKVQDTRTCLKEIMYNGNEFGVYIDIFPLDGVKDFRQIDKIRRWNKYLNAKKATIDKQRTFLKNVVICIGKLFLIGISAKKIVKHIDALARECDYLSSSNVGAITAPEGRKEVVDKKVFERPILCQFEDAYFNIPVGFDDWLKKQYGDYMLFPPKEQQVSHHAFEAWWKEE